MKISEQLQQLRSIGNKLVTAIEDKSWDEASEYSKEWDTGMRGLFNCLSSDQFSQLKSELDYIANQNQFIIEKIIHLRAKTLTLLQDYQDSRRVHTYYNNMPKR